jgi:hypothetical protein
MRKKHYLCSGSNIFLKGKIFAGLQQVMFFSQIFKLGGDPARGLSRVEFRRSWELNLKAGDPGRGLSRVEFRRSWELNLKGGDPGRGLGRVGFRRSGVSDYNWISVF